MAEPPVSRSPTTTGRVALGLGLAGLIVALLGLTLVVADARAEISRLFYVIDPETGFIGDVVPGDQRSTAIQNVYIELSDRIAALLCVGWVGLALTWWGVYRRERSTGLRLRRIAAPLLMPVGALLSAATLLDYRFDGNLEWLLDHFTRNGAMMVGQCMPSLSGCSHAQGYELLRMAVLGVTGISVALLIPAAREAWHAGVRGRQLSRSGSVAAIICFGVGSLAFVSTRTIREDHQHTLAPCKGEAWPQHEDRAYESNASSIELQAARVDGPRPQAEFTSRPVPAEQFLTRSEYRLGEFQIFASGELSELPDPGVRRSVDESLEHVGLSNAAFQAELHVRIENFKGYWEDVEDPVLVLYVDERVPLARMHELLEIARATRVSTVLVLGEARFERGLPSIGSWVRRVHAPHAKLLLGEGELRFDNFTTWKQLSDTAASRGPEGLALRVD
jgi:hypothetical protein